MIREYIGVDLHKRFFQACAVTVTGDRLWEQRFPRTADGVARFSTRVTGDSAIAVEAMGPTWAFVDAVAPAGAAVCVVDPRKTKLKAGHAAKTDRLDARRLADALRRDSVVRIYIPPPEIRALREVCRGRHQLVRLRTRLAQMIRALLLRCAAGEPPGSTLHAARALAWLTMVQLAPEAAASQLRRLERLYRAVHADALAADAEVKTYAACDPIACALATITGVGPILGLTLRAEIGDATRFSGGPALASYAGLVPRVESSGDRVYHGRITRQGSPWIRWALVEAARYATRRPDARGRWARRLAVTKGLAKARVAMARRLCDDVIATWRAGQQSA
jgi:transposase